MCTYALITEDICWTNLLSNLESCIDCELMDIQLAQSHLNFLHFMHSSKITCSLAILLSCIFHRKINVLKLTNSLLPSLVTTLLLSGGYFQYISSSGKKKICWLCLCHLHCPLVPQWKCSGKWAHWFLSPRGRVSPHPSSCILHFEFLAFPCPKPAAPNRRPLNWESIASKLKAKTTLTVFGNSSLPSTR